MPKPWERYQKQDGPWSRYQQATQQEATPDERDNWLGKVDAAVRGIADTVTFGLADEIAAGLSTGFGLLGDYDSALAQERAIDAADTENRFGYRLGGQLAGGVLGGTALARSGLSATANLAPTASRLDKVVAGAIEGAALGGAYGFGSGEGVVGRITGGVGGAALGGTVGAAVPLVAEGAGHAVRVARDRLRAGQIAREAGASPEALRTLGGILQADDSLSGAGRANMARAGSEAMLVDAGPTARRALDTAIQRAGPGAREAKQAINERVARSAQSLNKTLNETLGNPQGVTAARTAIREGTSAARSAAYDAAYSAPIDYASQLGREIEGLVKTRVPAQAIRRANELMRLEGAQSQQILANIMDDGTVVLERLPDVRQLDYITRALNDLAEAGEGAGALGGQTALGRAYQNLSHAIRDRLKQLVPEYKTALDVAADPIRRSKAVELGSKILSRSMTRDQVAEAVKGMSGAEREALKLGLRSQIDDLMANVQRTVADGDTSAREAIKALKELSSRANREKVGLAIGKEAADKLFDELDRIATSFDLRAAVADNSATFARQAMERRIRDMSGGDGVISTLAQGEPVNAAKRIVQALTGETPQTVAAREDAMYGEIARLLTQRGGPSQRIYQGIERLGQTDAATRELQLRIINALSGPRASYPSSVLLLDMLR